MPQAFFANACGKSVLTFAARLSEPPESAQAVVDTNYQHAEGIVIAGAGGQMRR